MHKVVLGNLLEESAEELYDQAPCGYMSAFPDGTIIKINQTLLDWLGYTRLEVVGIKKFQHLLSTGGKIFYETYHASLLQTKGFVKELNYDIVRKDSTKFAALLNAVQVRDGQGNVTLIRTTIFDITERKKYEQVLLAARKKAEEATQAKAEFVSTISHEIRTPMNAVIGISHLLMDSTLSQQQREWVEMLNASSQHLLGLINNVLDFSKIESGKISLEQVSFPVRQLLEGILFGLQVKADEKNLALGLQLDQRVPAYLIGDPVKISQILTNLVGNAIKFTAQGSVTLAVALKGVREEKVSIDFSVTDTGIGIPAEKRSLIFEPFTQASYNTGQIYGGTGLGLSISRKLLDLYGSKLELISEPAKGSVFYFTLQLRASTPVSALQTTGLSLPATALKGRKVLIAEDNEVNVKILTQFLKKWEIAYEVVVNGALALEKVKEKNYDLILMDLQMPVMDGYEASRQIRLLAGKKYQTLPIIALSASERTQVPKDLHGAGMNDFVGKPFHPEELFQTMASYILSGYSLKGITSIRTQQDSTTFSSAQQSLNLKEKQREEPTVNLMQFTLITGNDAIELQRLIELSISSFIGYKIDLPQSIITRDLPLLEKLAHKSKMTFSLLQANKLLHLIEEGKGLLQGKAGNEPLQQMALAIETEIEMIVLQLQQHLQQLQKRTKAKE